MICMRCGHCCLKYCVVVVKDPEKGLDKDNIIFLDGNTRCPHLIGDKIGQYSCKIHSYSWFADTPCGEHEQFERSNTKCRIGEYLIEKLPTTQQ